MGEPTCPTGVHDGPGLKSPQQGEVGEDHCPQPHPFPHSEGSQAACTPR